MTSPLQDVRSAALVAALVAFAAFANSFAARFAFDDAHIILENTELHSLKTLPGAVLQPFWHGHEEGGDLGLWRPTTTLVLGLEFALAGESPTPYHVVNVIGHALATALVVLVLAHLVSIPMAFLAGLIFAVHPVHVEAVSNVIGGAEVLAAGLVLWALLVHLGGASTWTRALAVGAIYAAAFGAKESAVTLPVLVLLVDAARRRLDWADLRRYVAERWRTYVVLAAVAGLMLAARARILGSIADPDAALGSGLLLDIPRIWTLTEVWSHYVRLMVFPLDLASDYSPGVIPISTSWHALNLDGLALALAALLGALLTWRRPALGREGASGGVSARVFGFGVVWFMMAVSPVANVVFVSGVLLAERTLYLPSVGAVVVLAWALLGLIRRRRRLGLAAAGLVIALMGVRSFTRTPTWHDDSTMFGALMEQYPQSGRSQWLIGDNYMALGLQKEALMAYREAVQRMGASAGLTAQIGRKLMVAGNLRGAAALLEQSRSEAPDVGTAPALLGVVYTEMGEWAKAEEALSAAVRLQPANVVSHHLRAGALMQLGRWEEAALERRQVIALGEDVWQQWTGLADAEQRAGHARAAAAAIQEALARAGSDEERARIEAFGEELAAR